ncbi:MAG TPA: delta-60 repeat domain-containing protein [Rhodanobacteraceae bacterium]|nr:delta-60 repeat domain-containing protein [Rhodanobacteraceae bacterium]
MPARSFLFAALAACACACARDGDLDPSFGSGGTTAVGFGAIGWVYGLAIDANGKIVLGGRVDGGATLADFAAVRLTSDGLPDATFGSGGRVVIPMGAGEAYDEANSVLVQTDGRIVIAGLSDVAADDRDFALLRLDDDGTPDPTFGDHGRVFVRFDLGSDKVDEAHAAVQQADGRLVVAGRADVEGQHADFALARLDAHGALDPDFGDAGRLTFHFHDAAPNYDSASSVAIDAAGRILVAGVSRKDSGYDDDFAIARLLPDGTFDPSFGDGGRAIVAFDLGGDLSDEVAETIVAPDGSIYLVGVADAGSAHGTSYRCAAAKLKADGTLDASWASGGKFAQELISGDDSEYCEGAALQPDGKLVLAGSVADDVIMTRLDRTGSLDFGFGSSGVSFHPGGVATRLRFREGRLVFAGVTPNAAGSEFLAGRAIADTIFGDGFD